MEPLHQKSCFLFPEIFYLKTDEIVSLILFLVKNFEEKGIELLKERLCQKLPSNDATNGLAQWNLLVLVNVK